MASKKPAVLLTLVSHIILKNNYPFSSIRKSIYSVFLCTVIPSFLPQYCQIWSYLCIDISFFFSMISTYVTFGLPVSIPSAKRFLFSIKTWQAYLTSAVLSSSLGTLTPNSVFLILSCHEHVRAFLWESHKDSGDIFCIEWVGKNNFWEEGVISYAWQVFWIVLAYFSGRRMNEWMQSLQVFSFPSPLLQLLPLTDVL